MKSYETVKIEIVDFLDDAIRTSGEDNNKGVYEQVNDLDPTKQQDWF